MEHGFIGTKRRRGTGRIAARGRLAFLAVLLLAPLLDRGPFSHLHGPTVAGAEREPVVQESEPTTADQGRRS